MRSKNAEIGRDKEDVYIDYSQLISSGYIKNLLNSIPYNVAILNTRKEIVFSNDAFLHNLKIKSLEDILGLRLGEAMGCVNTEHKTKPCGEQGGCQFCNAIETIKESSKSKDEESKECRLTAEINGERLNYDFMITAKPFLWNKSLFTILSLKDITNKKRRAVLEKIFFHDVINKVGSLNGYFELIKEFKEIDKIKPFIENASLISRDLTEDIVSQRELLEAENNELLTHKSMIMTADMLDIVKDFMSHHQVCRGKNIKIAENSANTIIHTDFSLMKRIMINLVKNALEAIKPGETVTLNCERKSENIILSVHNPGFMPKSVEMQVFQRSFSTKGEGRGIGTYSVKLLTEKYLGGKVFFNNDQINGIRFNVMIKEKEPKF